MERKDADKQQKLRNCFTLQFSLRRETTVSIMIGYFFTAITYPERLLEGCEQQISSIYPGSLVKGWFTKNVKHISVSECYGNIYHMYGIPGLDSLL